MRNSGGRRSDGLFVGQVSKMDRSGALKESGGRSEASPGAAMWQTGRH